jgi:hypothetical protein
MHPTQGLAINGRRVKGFFVACLCVSTYAYAPMTSQSSVTIPPRLTKRLRALAADDDDLMSEHRDRSEQQCLRSHYRRIWEKLSNADQELLRTQNPGCADYDLVGGIADLLRGYEGNENPLQIFWESEGSVGAESNSREATRSTVVHRCWPCLVRQDVRATSRERQAVGVRGADRRASPGAANRKCTCCR